MKLYRTHILIGIKDEKKLNLSNFGDVKFVLKPEPSMCYWQSKDGIAETILSSPQEINFIPKEYIQQNELLIEAKSSEIAEDILSIVHGGTLLAYPSPTPRSELFYVMEYVKEHDEQLYSTPPFIHGFRKIEYLGFGCHIAQCIFNNQQAVYSIEKYKASLELASFEPYNIDPRFGQYFEHYDIKRQFHTRAALAIIAAFSVIEELELEIRSSSKNHRFLDNNTGKWNPIVYSDIQKRLFNANIKATETFDWVYRGNETRIEQKITPFFGYDSEWVKYGDNVRDKTLTFPEAIHNASYLRNFISSHKFTEMTQYISPYDIYNVQELARKLILFKYGFWAKLFEKG